MEHDNQLSNHGDQYHVLTQQQSESSMATPQEQTVAEQIHFNFNDGLLSLAQQIIEEEKGFQMLEQLNRKDAADKTSELLDNTVERQE